MWDDLTHVQVLTYQVVAVAGHVHVVLILNVTAKMVVVAGQVVEIATVTWYVAGHDQVLMVSGPKIFPRE